MVCIEDMDVKLHSIKFRQPTSSDDDEIGDFQLSVCHPLPGFCGLTLDVCAERVHFQMRYDPEYRAGEHPPCLRSDSMQMQAHQATESSIWARFCPSIGASQLQQHV